MARKRQNRKTANLKGYKAPAVAFRASPKGMAREALKEELAKTGATLAPNGMEKTADGGAYFSIPMPFQPEFGDPSKLHFPIDRHQQNRYWRLINKTDPVIGSVIDMFAEMLCSDIDISGEGITGEIKCQYEEMIQSTQIVSMFQYFIKEFLIVGEVIPHLVFDETKGIWTDLLFHNPDQVNVMSTPFMNMEPILDFIPDESLKSFVQSNNPQVLEYLSNLPEDILASILSNNSIPLNTQMNVSFIPRRLHPYDVRGTSIMPRLWQIYMYESAIMNASIATARRHAGPIKVLKVGDPNGNWLPTETDLSALMEKLTMAEQDPHAWLTSHPFLEFEAWGTTDRMMSISREYDLIERVKLTALGVSQGFLHGESTYASSDVNMNTLLMRLRGLRKFFEGVWWIPKFFKPIAEINDWYHSTPAEVSHRVKTKRTASEQRLIIPKIKWRQTLEPVVDKDLLEAIRVLNDMGIKSSKGTSFGAAGLDFESETTNSFVEQKIEKQIREKILPAEKDEHDQIEEEISIPGGAPLSPATPPGNEGQELEDELTAPDAEAGEEGAEPEVPTPETMEPAPASKKGFMVSAADVDDLVDLLETGKTASDIWGGLVGKKEKPTVFLKNCDWERILGYMEDEGFSNKEIEYTRKSLVRKGTIDPELHDRIEAALEKVEKHALLGGKDQIDEILDNNIKKKMAKFTEATNKAAADTNADIDMLFAGEGNYKHATGEFILKKGGNMSKDKIDNYRRKKKGGK